MEMPDAWKKMRAGPDGYLRRLPEAGVVRIVWNKPEKRNSLTQAMMDGAREALEMVRDDPNLKVVITRGEGNVYSSGLNLQFLRSESYRRKDWDHPGPT